MKELQFLYLANCEKEGEGYWEIGLTRNLNLLQERKDFIECHRKELIGIIAAKAIINAIEINITNLINDCLEDGYVINKPYEGISYDLPLHVLEEIYDFWLTIYQDSDLFLKVLNLLLKRKKLNLSNPSIYKGLKGFTAIWVSKVEKLHSYRPPSKQVSLHKDPMWIDT